MVPTIQSGWGGQPGMLTTGVLMPACLSMAPVPMASVTEPLAAGMPPEAAQVPRASTAAASGASFLTRSAMVISVWPSSATTQ